jgi:hypothetical protein
MTKTARRVFWSECLDSFVRRHHQEATRLGVFERQHGKITDFWLEDGMILTGVSAETDSDGAVSAEIMLETPRGTDNGHFTHSVRDVRSLRIILTPNGESDGLEIEDSNGATTILRFENFG